VTPRPQEDNTHAVEIVERAYASIPVDMDQDDLDACNILSSVYNHLCGGENQVCYGSVEEWVRSGGSA